MMEGEDDDSPSTKTEPSNGPKQLLGPRKKRNKNKNKNERRFSDEQIRSLESIFKSERKLDPRKKLQLAREVGLQPRQIAIWFQNKRARWKSKQLEEDYRILKANYDNLHARFESLKNENQSLLFQLKELSDLLKKPHDGEQKIKKLRENSTRPGCCQLNYQRGSMNSDDERGGEDWCCKQEEEASEFLNRMGEQQVDGSMVKSPDKWCKFDNSVALIDHSGGSSNWWDLWT